MEIFVLLGVVVFMTFAAGAVFGVFGIIIGLVITTFIFFYIRDYSSMSASYLSFLILSISFIVSSVLSIIYLRPQYYKWKKENLVRELEDWQIENLKNAIDKNNLSEDRQVIDYIKRKILEK